MPTDPILDVYCASVRRMTRKRENTIQPGRDQGSIVYLYGQRGLRPRPIAAASSSCSPGLNSARSIRLSGRTRSRVSGHTIASTLLMAVSDELLRVPVVGGCPHLKPLYGPLGGTGSTHAKQTGPAQLALTLDYIRVIQEMRGNCT
jgi:hypothetical protein